MDIYSWVLIIFCIIIVFCVGFYSDKTTSYFDIIVLILFLGIVVFMFFKHQKYDVVYVKSDIDGESYLVRDLPDKQSTANMLAKIRKNMFTLNDYLVQNKSSFPAYTQCIDLLNSKIKNSVIMENGEDNVYTSYSVNKGEQIVFCLRSKTTKDKIHDLNLMMYVVLHEMAHVGCQSIGHTDEFKMIFAFYTEQAIKIGLYKKIDFHNNNKEYCGMTITESII
ncbi:hypothetical protein Catovirus_2_225 [Catovirus CTV1]|uniref:Uncharacterized protein n=1 Tax=Catovirus CTV1 TaxID=1977631 RepID=A0A1V0SC42_9VIRU|nr:hypothetical protein Catovirus_2_225 [Catovirus CTV1]